MPTSLVLEARKIVEYAHELPGIREGKRAEQDAVNDAEGGDVGADAEGQRENRDQGEAGSLEQHAAGVAHILQERGHFGSS